MLEERFKCYVFQIMKYVRYQENAQYIECILNDMANKLFREDRNYIVQLEQENKQLKDKMDKAIEYIKEYQETQAKYCYVDFDKEDIDKLLEILGGKEK